MASRVFLLGTLPPHRWRSMSAGDCRCGLREGSTTLAGRGALRISDVVCSPDDIRYSKSAQKLRSVHLLNENSIASEVTSCPYTTRVAGVQTIKSRCPCTRTSAPFAERGCHIPRSTRTGCGSVACTLAARCATLRRHPGAVGEGSMTTAPSRNVYPCVHADVLRQSHRRELGETAMDTHGTSGPSTGVPSNVIQLVYAMAVATSRAI